MLARYVRLFEIAWKEIRPSINQQFTLLLTTAAEQSRIRNLAASGNISLPTIMTSSPFLSFRRPLKVLTSLHLDDLHRVRLRLSRRLSSFTFRPH